MFSGKWSRERLAVERQDGFDFYMAGADDESAARVFAELAERGAEIFGERGDYFDGCTVQIL